MADGIAQEVQMSLPYIIVENTEVVSTCLSAGKLKHVFIWEMFVMVKEIAFWEMMNNFAYFNL
jgi:hypothetical protein